MHQNGVILGTLSYEEFVNRVAGLQSESTIDSVEVRQLLNEYIAAIDAYDGNQYDILDGAIQADRVSYANTSAVDLPSPPGVRTFEAFPDDQNNSATGISFEEVYWNY